MHWCVCPVRELAGAPRPPPLTSATPPGSRIQDPPPTTRHPGPNPQGSSPASPRWTLDPALSVLQPAQSRGRRANRWAAEELLTGNPSTTPLTNQQIKNRTRRPPAPTLPKSYAIGRGRDRTNIGRAEMDAETETETGSGERKRETWIGWLRCRPGNTGASTKNNHRDV